MAVNAVDKVIINLIVCCTLCTSGNATAATNEYDDLEESTSITNITNQQDIGVFVLSRIVDAVTGRPVDNVEISSTTNKTLSDQNGEFLIKVEPNGYILLRKENYKETSIQVSALRGKIKLELIPKYLPIFPGLSASINYRNLGFSEKFNDITSSGRYNDSFSVDLTSKISFSFSGGGTSVYNNNFLVGLNYENISGILNRSSLSEKANQANHLISLKGGYAFNILKDTLEAAAGLKGYWNNITLSNQTFNEDVGRDPDYLDFGSARTAVGIDLELGARPIRYTPLVLNAFVTYYPLVSVTQPAGGQLPANMNQVDFGVGGRFDFSGAYAQIKYLNKSLFQGSFTSNLSGISGGIGYGF